MLTYNYVTVPNAIEVFKEIQDTEVTHIGFKDAGLPIRELRTLVALMRDAGKVIFRGVERDQGKMQCVPSRKR